MCGGAAKATMPDSAIVQGDFAAYLNDVSNRQEFKNNEASLKKREAQDHSGYFEGRSSADQALATQGVALKKSGQRKFDDSVGGRIAKSDVSNDLRSEIIARSMQDDGLKDRQRRAQGDLSLASDGLAFSSQMGVASAMATANAETSLNKAKEQAIAGTVSAGVQAYGMEQGYQDTKGDSALTRKEYYGYGSGTWFGSGRNPRPIDNSFGPVNPFSQLPVV